MKESIDSLKSYKLSETADWIAYKRSSKSDSVLHVRPLDGAKEILLADVKEFGFAKKGNILYYTTDSTLSTFTPDKGSSLIFEGKGVIKKVTFDEAGSKIAFLHSPDKDSISTQCSLYLSENNIPARLVADRKQSFIPDGWVISENGDLRFSKNAERLFFRYCTGSPTERHDYTG